MRMRFLAAATFVLPAFVLSAPPTVGAQSAPAQAAASTAISPAAAPAPAPAYLSDPKFTNAMAEARQLVGKRQFTFAADAYKKANKIAGGRCLDCLKGQYTAEMDGAAYKNAANTASLMQALADTPAGKSAAAYRQANALVDGAGDKPKPAQMEAAHGILQEALGLYPRNAPALFLDGKVLARLGKMDEAKADFSKCVSCVAPNDPARLRAEHFAENPELSLHRMAPPLVVTALDGSKFNLDAMSGHVVLIDFWATWCPSCNAEIPHMNAIAKRFAGQPLTMISVSVDKDDAKWKEFLAKNGMTWMQYRDDSSELSKQFAVTTIPRYFTVDSDGVLTSVNVGGGSDIEGQIKKLIAKAREVPKDAVAAAPAAGNAPGN